MEIESEGKVKGRNGMLEQSWITQDRRIDKVANE